jgi:uncharacterized protein YegJ (DUF2314 family)
MPTLDADGWELESAEARHAAAPTTFGIPSRAERIAVPVGRMVKLLFLFMNEENGAPIVDCERMWVTVLSATNGGYTGRLESEPATSRVLAPGQIVAFTSEHISAVLVSEMDPTHPRHRSPRSWWNRLLGR